VNVTRHTRQPRVRRHQTKPLLPEWIRHIIRGVLGSGYEEKYVPPPTPMNQGDAHLASSGRCKPRARAGSLFMHLLLDARDLPPTVSSLSLVHGHLDTRHDITHTSHTTVHCPSGIYARNQRIRMRSRPMQPYTQTTEDSKIPDTTPATWPHDMKATMPRKHNTTPASVYPWYTPHHASLGSPCCCC